MNKNDNLKKIISNALLICGMTVAAACCLFQYMYYSGFRRIDLTSTVPVDIDCVIEDIHWKDTDHDFITGRFSSEGEPMTFDPVYLVLYTDDDNTGYRIPIKTKNYYTAEQEAEFEKKDMSPFIYTSREYLNNSGEPSEETEFYCQMSRHNSYRNNFKIAFLFETEDGNRIYKTDILYRYYGID